MRIKTLGLLIGIAFCFSCSPGGKSAEPSAQTKAFLALFKPLMTDTTRVLYESKEDRDGHNLGQFAGLSIDSTYWALLDTNAVSHRKGGPFFACYRFPLSDTTCGLIIREPSLYVESSIQLSVFDAKHARCLRILQLADEWGDAGATFRKFSLLSFQKGVISVAVREIQTGPVDMDWEKFGMHDSTSNFLLVNNQFLLSSRKLKLDSTWVYTGEKP